MSWLAGSNPSKKLRYIIKVYLYRAVLKRQSRCFKWLPLETTGDTGMIWRQGRLLDFFGLPGVCKVPSDDRDGHRWDWSEVEIARVAMWSVHSTVDIHCRLLSERHHNHPQDHPHNNPHDPPPHQETAGELVQTELEDLDLGLKNISGNPYIWSSDYSIEIGRSFKDCIYFARYLV